MTRIGLLHTVPALAPLFTDLVTEQRADLDLVHTVDAALLTRTIEAGEVTPEVAAAVTLHLRALAAAGAEAVLVTCSSIGEAAEEAAAETGVPLTRVDAAMARIAVERARAAAHGGAPARIAVLATLTATLGPTGRIVEREARTGAPVEVTSTVVAGAAAARSAGDQQTHDALIAEAVRTCEADVIVLAQASMAAAAGDDARVLTSPASGAAAFVASLPAAGAS